MASLASPYKNFYKEKDSVLSATLQKKKKGRKCSKVESHKDHIGPEVDPHQSTNPVQSSHHHRLWQRLDSGHSPRSPAQGRGSSILI